MHRHFLGAFLLAGLLVTPAGAAPPGGPRFVEAGHRVDYFEDAAAGGFAISDVDADGREDVIFLGKAKGRVLFVLGKAEDGVTEIKSALQVPDDVFYARTLVGTVNGVRRVLTVGSNGTVRFYGGWPLAAQGSMTIVPDVRWAETGDVDGDGKDDLVVLTDQRLLRYDLDSGLLTGTLPVKGCTSLTLAQLDADPALELILGGIGPGRVLDGATFAVDWEYLDSFGYWPVAGRFTSSEEMRWFGNPYLGAYTLFRAHPWSPLWSGNAFENIVAMTAADLEGSGRDHLLLSLPYQLQAIDPRTQQLVSTIPTNGEAVARTGVADLDGSGLDKVVFSSPRSADIPQITLADGISGAAIWRFLAPNGPFKAIGLGDVDGDGRVELVAAGAIRWSSTSTRVIIDTEKGRERWRSPRVYDPYDSSYIGTHSIELLPRENLPGLDIVFAGEALNGGRLTVVDGATMQPRQVIGVEPGIESPMDSRSIQRVIALDYDGDGIRDYAVATEPKSTGTTGARIFVYSGSDGALLWQSPVLGANFPKVHDFFAVHQEGGDSEFVLALDDGLRAFSATSGLLTWTLAVPLNGAAWLPRGIDGQELLVFSEDGAVSLFDYDTRMLLRSFSLPSPLRAVSALDGDVSHLIAAASGRLLLVDAIDGTIRATTDVFDSMSEPMKPLAVLPRSASTWQIAAGGDSVLAWFRLDLTDRMFQDGFD